MEYIHTMYMIEDNQSFDDLSMLVKIWENNDIFTLMVTFHPASKLPRYSVLMSDDIIRGSILHKSMMVPKY